LWFAVAMTAEVVSYLAAAELERHLLASGGVRLRRRSLIAVTWASDAVGASFPAGAAVSVAYTYRQLTRRGATSGLAGWVLVATAVLSGSVLVSLALLGAQIRGAAAPCVLLAAAVTVGFLSLACSGVLALAWAGARPSRLDAVARHLIRARTAMRKLVRTAASRSEATQPGWPHLQPIMLGRAQWAGGVALAIVNWSADGAALAFCLVAVGVAVPLHGFLLAYALSQLAATLPLLPGAIGVAEGSMVIALVCAGVKPGDALAATFAYRLVSFWLQLPAGWLAWASLRRRRDVPSPTETGDLVAA
jgi:hypothetical protein